MASNWVKNCCCVSFSTPSATICRFNAFASATIAATMVAPSPASLSSCTKARSIFSSHAGRRFQIEKAGITGAKVVNRGLNPISVNLVSIATLCSGLFIAVVSVISRINKSGRILCRARLRVMVSTSPGCSNCKADRFTATDHKSYPCKVPLAELSTRLVYHPATDSDDKTRFSASGKTGQDSVRLVLDDTSATGPQILQ